MGKLTIKKLAVAAAFSVALAVMPAKAAWEFDLGVGNTAISGYTGPYAHVVVDLTSSTTATLTFESLTANGNIYLLGDGGSVAVNVNATSWTLGTITGSNAGTGFTPGAWSDGGAGNEDGFGSFNQTINSFDGFTHSSDKISFGIENKSGTWASVYNVLTPNADGKWAAAHIFVTASPAIGKNPDGSEGSALATGYATVPEPTTVIAGALLLLPFAASTVRVLRKKS